MEVFDDDTVDIDTTVDPVKSKITSLRLKDCQIPPEILRHLLAGFEALTTFENLDDGFYDHTENRVEGPQDPNAIVRGLLTSAASTLRVMHLSSSTLDIPYEHVHLPTRLGRFQALREVKIDHRFLGNGEWIRSLCDRPSIEVFYFCA